MKFTKRTLATSNSSSSSFVDYYDYDALVYDASSGGVTAAVSAARSGLRVALLCASYPSCFQEGGKRIGGLSSGGLGQTDIGPTYPYIGGLAKEFYTRNRAYYGNVTTTTTTATTTTNVTATVTVITNDEDDSSSSPPSLLSSSDEECRLPSNGCNVTFNLEPGVARTIFENLLAESKVDVFFEAQVSSVFKTASGIMKSLTTVDKRRFVAKVFIDASYEGDVLQRANVSTVIGRESQSTYNESLAGLSAGSKGNQFSLPVDPFDDAGRPLPFLTLPMHNDVPGAADSKVQSYNFRLCVTKEPENSVPFPKPEHYNASEWEFLRRYLIACAEKRKKKLKGSRSSSAMEKAEQEEEEVEEEEEEECQLGFPSCNTAAIPQGKFDMNNCGGFSTDFIGGSWKYPDGNYTVRKSIWYNHLRYQQGLLYFMTNDPSVPTAFHDQMAPWGLCKDEFADNTISPHWPPALYVRAARRLKGDRVFTQNEPDRQRTVMKGNIGNESIAIGGYNFDSHNAERLACQNMTACFGEGPEGVSPDMAFAWNEGDVEIAPGLYQIPVWIMFPQRSEARNLLSVAAPSASHIGMSSLRMEPQFMMIGEAAGIVAALALEEARSVVTTETTLLDHRNDRQHHDNGDGGEVVTVQDVDLDIMRERLLDKGAILEL